MVHSSSRLTSQGLSLLLALLSVIPAMSSLTPNDFFPADDVALNDRVQLMLAITYVVGALSTVSSLAVLLTPILFPKMWHGKICMQMIVMISVCDFMVGCGVMFGFASGSLCSVSEQCFFVIVRLAL